ncbi:hypothetical protein [Profundibacter sp.]|uniref:hypothetical protein n=1 Tax=Profundibacter sp. TaxID=3101071 RepID=UPI003D0C46DD
MKRYLLALLLPLAGCSTALEQCVNRSTKNLQAVDDLIATTQANIDRGYALDSRPQVSIGLQLCTSPSANFHFCTGTQTSPKQAPVAIDVAAERRKLAELKSRRAVLKRQSDLVVRACVAKNQG